MAVVLPYPLPTSRGGGEEFERPTVMPYWLKKKIGVGN
jgi:hypothetical protein